MPEIQKQYPLENNNTFGINARAAFYCAPRSISELEDALQFAADEKVDYYIIGEGSNLLFTKDYEGLIIHPCFEKLEIKEEDDHRVLLLAGAGINWDQFVQYCVTNKWYGAENLSLIPGSVGAAPVQNIGAYGVEAKDLIRSVEAYDCMRRAPVIFQNEECEFGYRDSIFKRSDQGKYVVTNVEFSLQKEGDFLLNYGNVREKFMEMPEQSLESLRNTIIMIREGKLPDPEKTGNAGSFFKNPVIPGELFQKIRNQNNKIPGFPAGSDKFKVPAAWLIEQAGWKGIREGDIGTWPLQPLVIVNYGNADGESLYKFSEKIRQAVLAKFGINLEREVTVI